MPRDFYQLGRHGTGKGPGVVRGYYSNRPTYYSESIEQNLEAGWAVWDQLSPETILVDVGGPTISRSSHVLADKLASLAEDYYRFAPLHTVVYWIDRSVVVQQAAAGEDDLPIGAEFSALYAAPPRAARRVRGKIRRIERVRDDVPLSERDWERLESSDQDDR